MDDDLSRKAHRDHRIIITHAANSDRKTIKTHAVSVTMKLANSYDSYFDWLLAMVSVPHNITTTHDAFVLAPFSLLGDMCAAAASRFPLRFSFAQQVHVKLKAEAAVMFVFYSLKQVCAYLRSWQARREKRRPEEVKVAVKREKQKRKKRKKRNHKCKSKI